MKINVEFAIETVIGIVDVTGYAVIKDGTTKRVLTSITVEFKGIEIPFENFAEYDRDDIRCAFEEAVDNHLNAYVKPKNQVKIIPINQIVNTVLNGKQVRLLAIGYNEIGLNEEDFKDNWVWCFADTYVKLTVEQSNAVSDETYQEVFDNIC